MPARFSTTGSRQPPAALEERCAARLSGNLSFYHGKRRFRHSAIFGALGALEPGEAMRFVNDHDPLPLLDQLRARFGERIEIHYVQRESGAIVIDFVVIAKD